MTRVSSRLGVVPILTLVLALVLAAPAAAQSSGGDQYGENGEACVEGLLVRATGALQKPDATSYGYGTHAITDEQSGCQFALQSEQVDLDRYVGERVTVTGTTARGYPVDGGPVLLNVREVERARSGGGNSGETATLSFEVDAEGQVPQDATFFGFSGPPGGASPTQLTDPDGDGTYTASVEAAKGEPVAVKIEKGSGTQTVESALAGREITLPGEPREVIRGFETITLSEDGTISATYTFSGNGGGSPDGPGDAGGQHGEPGSGGDQYGDGGSEDGGTSEATIPVLPDTGGASLFALGAGALLAASGLLARRISR